MDSAPTWYVRLNGKTHGPLVDEDLRQLITEGFLDRASEVASSTEGPWTDLESSLAASRVSPAASRLIQRDNPPGGTPLRIEDLIAASNLRRPVSSPSNNSAPQPASAAHDVASLLALNLHVDKLHGLNRLKPVPRPASRRRRDYLVLMSLIGALIFLVLLAEIFIGVQLQVLAAKMPDQLWPMFRFVAFHSPLFAWGLAAFSFYAIALGWLMFWVMDEY